MVNDLQMERDAFLTTSESSLTKTRPSLQAPFLIDTKTRTTRQNEQGTWDSDNLTSLDDFSEQSSFTSVSPLSHTVACYQQYRALCLKVETQRNLKND